MPWITSYYAQIKANYSLDIFQFYLTYAFFIFFRPELKSNVLKSFAYYPFSLYLETNCFLLQWRWHLHSKSTWNCFKTELLKKTRTECIMESVLFILIKLRLHSATYLVFHSKWETFVLFLGILNDLRLHQFLIIRGGVFEGSPCLRQGFVVVLRVMCRCIQSEMPKANYNVHKDWDEISSK